MTPNPSDRLTEAERAEFRRAIAEGTAIRRHLAVKALAQIDAAAAPVMPRPTDTHGGTE